jgi:hypothetical protein
VRLIACTGGGLYAAHSPEARIVIGDRSFVNGTRFGCAAEISVGADALRGGDPQGRHRGSRLGDRLWRGGDQGRAPGRIFGGNPARDLGAVPD